MEISQNFVAFSEHMNFMYQKIIFSKHQNKAEFKNLDDSEVLISDISGPITSAAPSTSSTSITSLAFTFLN